MLGTTSPWWLGVTESRAARLRSATAELRAACRAHPFVQGLADGSLRPQVFARWVVQDWRYLQTYVAVLDTVADAAPTADARQRWRETAALTRDEELDLHRAFAARFGLTARDLDHAPDWPATAAYTGFLRASAARSYACGVAALVPCGVGYVTLARALAEGPPPQDPRYVDWIRTYTDPAFASAVDWMEAELDVAGGGAEVDATYLEGARHELAFWEGLWRGRPD